MKQIKIVGAFSIAIIVVVSIIVSVLASEATSGSAQLIAEQDACRASGSSGSGARLLPQNT